MITAGLRRKPDESRLDLINRNVELFLNILGQVKARRAQARGDRPGRVQPGGRPDLPRRDASSACRRTRSSAWEPQLDTARFRSLIAEALKLPPTQVTALILGEHGDSMVPIWSAAQAAGLPLEKYPGWTSAAAEALFTRTKGSGAEVIKLKGGAGFAVGLSIREVVHSVALDTKRILPVSALVQRPVRHPRRLHLGPDRRRPEGVEAQLEIELWPKEVSALQHSAQVLRETIDQVQKSNRKAAGKPAAASGPISAGENRRQPAVPSA